MRSGELRIVNRLGLHARAAAKLVKLTKTFACAIELCRNESDATPVDAKSIMAVLMLEGVCGTRLTLTCRGEDEDDAFVAVGELVAARFGEGEEGVESEQGEGEQGAAGGEE